MGEYLAPGQLQQVFQLFHFTVSSSRTPVVWGVQSINSNYCLEHLSILEIFYRYYVTCWRIFVGFARFGLGFSCYSVEPTNLVFSQFVNWPWLRSSNDLSHKSSFSELSIPNYVQNTICCEFVGSFRHN